MKWDASLKQENLDSLDGSTAPKNSTERALIFALPLKSHPGLWPWGSFVSTNLLRIWSSGLFTDTYVSVILGDLLLKGFILNPS